MKLKEVLGVAQIDLWEHRYSPPMRAEGGECKQCWAHAPAKREAAERGATRTQPVRRKPNAVRKVHSRVRKRLS